MLHRYVSLLLLCSAAAVAAYPDQEPWQDMNLVGEAKLRVAIWDIYRARLFSTEEQFQQDSPFALKLTYLRDVKERHLLKETRKQWRHLGLEEQDFESWIAQLEEIWRDVNKADAITLFVDGNGHAHFYLNSQYAGSIKDREFSRHFADIWLSPKSSRPRLRNKLLGVS